MIRLDDILGFYPPSLNEKVVFRKYILKEYIQLMILEYLSSTPYIQKVAFIGGTSLRLIKGIDRFSEDLDFDSKNFSSEDFLVMTDAIVKYLYKNGWKVAVTDKENSRLTAFRRNLIFPELLYNFGLSGHKEERFLIKIECQDQQVNYPPEMVNIKACGFFFPIAAPSEKVLCAMKIAAMLNRRKGRDFYDVMFLLSRTMPDFEFLRIKTGISSLEDLIAAVNDTLSAVDLKSKMRDFEHLLFNRGNSARILAMAELMKSLQ